MSWFLTFVLGKVTQGTGLPVPASVQLPLVLRLQEGQAFFLFIEDLGSRNEIGSLKRAGITQKR